MSVSVIAVVNGIDTFRKLIRDVLFDLKSRNRDQISVDLLTLKRSRLEDGLKALKREIFADLEKSKGDAIAELAMRGLLNSTIKEGRIAGLEKEAHARFDAASDELKYAVAEIALEQRHLKA